LIRPGIKERQWSKIHCRGPHPLERGIDGYKRHVLRDSDGRLVVAVGVTTANVPETRVTDATDVTETDLATQQRTLIELHIDRVSLAGPMVQQRNPTWAIFCKTRPVHQGLYFPRSAFPLD
jgi:hypothetical protein